MMDINSAEFVISNTDPALCPDDNKPEYAFIGRSNVGKSSLINMLTNKRKLAMTSSTPGKTTLINHFIIDDLWYLVDLPGYGFSQRDRKKKKQIKDVIERYIEEREQMTCLFVLIDLRHDPQAIDLEFMRYLGENGVPFCIVFTKTDKLKGGEQKPKLQRYIDAIKKEWDELPPYFVTSSVKRLGRKEILGYIEGVNLSIKQSSNDIPFIQ